MSLKSIIEDRVKELRILKVDKALANEGTLILDIELYKLENLLDEFNKESCKGCSYLGDFAYTHPMCQTCHRCSLTEDNYNKVE